MSGIRETPALSVPHGYVDDARSRFLRARPPSRAIAWVEAALSATVVRVQALRGGSSSAVHAVRVEGPSRSESVILRRYVDAELNIEEPDIAEREARVLRFLHHATMPTPRLIAVDPSGAHAGVPTILMTRVPGRVDWTPRDVDAWLRRLAALLVPLHATRLPAGHGIRAFAPYEPESWARPEWMQSTRLWARALEIFRGPPLDPVRVLIHRDYHPGNVLWRRGRVAGVVDWQAASVGPPSVDVAWCRINLIARFGRDIADRFIDVWETKSGRSYHPWSEVVLLVDAIGSGHEHKRQAREDLENALGQRLGELGA